MSFDGLSSFVSLLKSKQELIEIEGFVNTELEITEIADRFVKSPSRGKALLFKNNGSRFPLLINMFATEQRLCLAAGIDHPDELGEKIQALFLALTKPNKGLLDKIRMLPLLKNVGKWMPEVIKSRGSCQDIVYKEVDLGILPILKCWQFDGGRFITLPIVNTIDPNTGHRNAGMYRMQVIDSRTTAMHWHRHKTGANHFEEYKKRGEKMPVTVVLGGDPVYTYAATAPLPENIDEYILAGFMRNKKVRLVKSLTNNIYIPEDADIVLEGYVDPTEPLFYEGPFGDHTGFYSLADYYPKFHITCITCSSNAIYPATIVGIPPMEDAAIAKLTERIFFQPIKLSLLPEIVDFNLPEAGIAHNLAIISINKTYPGQALKAMNTLWGAGQMMFTKVIVVVDKHVNVHDYMQVFDAFNKNCNLPKDILISKGPTDVLDHAARSFAISGKIGFDCTEKLPEEFSPSVDSNKDHNEAAFAFPLFVNSYRIAGNVILLAINKTNDLDTLVQDILPSLANKGVYLVIFTDHAGLLENDYYLTWMILSGIDPAYDIRVFNNHVFIDATAKISPSDRFQRDWPNILVMDNSIIEVIDRKWQFLSLGNYLPSPSLRFKPFLLSDKSEKIEK